LRKKVNGEGRRRKGEGKEKGEEGEARTIIASTRRQ